MGFDLIQGICRSWTEPLTNVKQNRIPMRADVLSTRCTITYCPSLSACLPTVKPTVVHVGIYVNSIGPVSSINMVSSGLCTHVTTSPDVSINRRNRGYSLEVGVVVVGGWRGVSCFTAGENEARHGFPLSPVSARMKPMSFKSRGGTDLCYGSSPLSGQAASFCSLGGEDLETQPRLRWNKALLSPSVCLEACFHLWLELEWWVQT